MFISFLYMFRATMCPSAGEITVGISATLGICHSVWMTVWYAGSVIQTVTNTECRIDTVISPDYGHIVT